MTTTSQTFTSSGTFVAPATLLLGGVNCSATGGSGIAGTSLGDPRAGSQVSGVIALSPSGTLIVVVGKGGNAATSAGGAGFSGGGGGGNDTTYGVTGSGGGGSSAVLSAGATLLLEAGGGAGSPLTGGGGGGFYGGNGGNATTGTGGGGGGGHGGNGASGGVGAGGTGYGASTGLSAVNGSSNSGTSGGGGGFSTFTGSISNGFSLDGASYIAPSVTSPSHTSLNNNNLDGQVTFTYVVADAPLSPTLTSPANAAFIDIANAGGTFQFTYNPGTDSGTQTAYAFRMKKLASGTITGCTTANPGVVHSVAHGLSTNDTITITGVGGAIQANGTWVITVIDADHFSIPVNVTGTYTSGGTWAGAYGYWNGTNFARTTPFWNTSASTSIVVPSGIFQDGFTYSWSMATQESHYSLQGTFASDLTFTGAVQPTINSILPSGSIQNATPTVTWTETIASGVQTQYRVVLYTAAQISGGSGSGVGASAYDSGLVNSAATSQILPTLVNGTVYTVYVQITETGGVTSPWTTQTFTLAFDAPATPITVATPNASPITGPPYIALAMATSDNLLGADDSSFEGSGSGATGTWAVTNCTKSAVSSWSPDGGWSLDLSSTGTSAMLANTVTPGNIPVAPGQVVTAMGLFHTSVSARTCSLQVIFYNASNAIITTTTIASGTDTTAAGGLQLSGQTTAPATSDHMELKINIAGPGAANEHHQIDQMGLYIGTVAPANWSMGGYKGALTAEIQYSDDNVNWFDVIGAGSLAVNSGQQASINDLRAPFNVLRYYRSRTLGTFQSQPVTSAWSPVVSTTLVLANWWISVPGQPSYGLALHRVRSIAGSSAMGIPVSLKIDKPQDQGRFNAFGRPNAVIVYGDMRSQEFDLAVVFLTQAEFNAFEAIRNLQTTVLLQSDMNGESYYVALGATRPVNILRASDRTKPTGAKELVIHCTPVDAPD
jgi:hypothetical protein